VEELNRDDRELAALGQVHISEWVSDGIRIRDTQDLNRGYGCTSGLLVAVKPGHAPRSSYCYRIRASLRAVCRSHFAPEPDMM